MTAVGDKETRVYSARPTRTRSNRKFDFAHRVASIGPASASADRIAASIIHGINDDLTLVSLSVKHESYGEEA